MAPATAPETMRKALAMGAASGVLVTDPALDGFGHRVDGPRPRGGARGRSSSTSCSPAPTPRTGCRASCRRASRRCGGCRTCRTRRRSSPTRRAGTRPRPPHQPDRLRRARGADARAHLAARRPSASRATRRSRGSWPPARKTIDDAARWPTSASTPRPSAAAVATTAVVDSRPPPPRAATRVVREAPDEAAAQVVAFLAERRIDLMAGGIWVDRRDRPPTGASPRSRPRSRRSPGRSAAAGGQDVVGDRRRGRSAAGGRGARPLRAARARRHRAGRPPTTPRSMVAAERIAALLIEARRPDFDLRRRRPGRSRRRRGALGADRLGRPRQRDRRRLADGGRSSR